MTINEIIESKQKEIDTVEAEFLAMAKEEKPDLLKFYYTMGLYLGSATTLNAFKNADK